MNCFNNFFITKIENIRKDLLANQPSNYSPTSDATGAPHLDSFRPISCKEAARFVYSYPSISCQSDPVPMDLLKGKLPVITPLTAHTVNASLETDIFPDTLKEALVKPLLKRVNLVLIDKNYRPVSDLEFPHKLLERVVTSQLMDQNERNQLMESSQSAYHQKHSTETALLKVKTDLHNAMDNQDVTCLLLLDLSAAFDMVDHSILLGRLEQCFGIKGTALSWIKSYLSNRSQCVVISDTNTDGSKSSSVPLSFGIPQGSVLGPILLTLYTHTSATPVMQKTHNLPPVC